MSGFPSVNFGSASGALFSPEEIARLMASEYQRSLRYGYPLAMLLVEIDRLESLHDLYGVESEQRIVRAVTSLLRSSTRASDVLGLARGARMQVVLPHAPREGALAVARRLLAGCRELEFRGDGRILRASLSIGTSARAEEGGLAALVEHAEEALEAALAAGGDRVQEYERLARSAPAAPRVERAREVRPAVPARARSVAAPRGLPSVDELAGSTMEEKVRSLLELTGASTDLGLLEREVLVVLQRTLDEARSPRAGRAEVLAEMRALEERIAQQKRLLEASEEELARLLREKSVDPGVASLFRTVQGLDPREHDYQRKKELLAVIYRANVELLKQLEKEAGRG